MDEQLNLLRRLYDEPGAEGPPAGASPEFEALAAVKAALDRLPKQRPDPAALEAVLAAASAATLEPVRALYEEPEAAPSSEAEALRPVKEALDRLPRQRPDPAALEAVVAAAASARAADRPARRPARARRRRALAGLALALALVAGSGLWLSREAGPEETPAVAETVPPAAPAPDATADALADEAQAAHEAPALAGSLAAASAPQAAPASRRSAPPPAAPPAPPAAEPPAVALAAEESLPLTDGEDELPLLYLRLLEMEEAQAGLGWDGPPVPVGEAPAEAPPASGWMQVRVER